MKHVAPMNDLYEYLGSFIIIFQDKKTEESLNINMTA